MKQIKYVLVLLAALVLMLSTVISVSADPDKVDDVSIQAMVPEGGESSYLGGSVLVTGFEPSEGFSPGYCAQNGWTAFLVSSTEGHIDTVNPASGTQHMRISGDSSIGAGNLTGCFSPLLAAPVTTPTIPMSQVLVDLYISGTGGADYDVAPQSPTQGFLTARVNFRFTGPIRVLDGGTFVDTGATWPVNTWFTLGITVDPENDMIDYTIDGTSIYTGSIVGGTIIEQVVLLSDNFHVTDDGDFDNLRIDNDYAPIPTDVSLTSFGESGNGSYALYFAPVLLLVLAGAFVTMRRKNEAA